MRYFVICYFINKNHYKEAAKTLVSVCCSIGAADGNFDKDEIALVSEMCTVLGVNSADFQI